MNKAIRYLNLFGGIRFVRLSIVFVIACALATGALIINDSIPGPMIQADEGSYLANAAAIAGFFNDMAGSYHAGYSLLIAPAFLVSQGPEAVWFTVKIINAFLLFTLFLALYWVSGMLKLEVSLWLRLSAVCAVSLYPMWIVMSGYAFSQIAMVPAFVIAFGILLSALAGKRWCWWVLGPLAGFLYWIHPTGIVAGVAASIGAVSYGIYRRDYIDTFLVPISFILIVLGYRYGFTPWLHDRMLSSGGGAHLHYPDSLGLLKILGSWVGLCEVASRLSGHFFYLTIGSVGFFWLGFYSLVKDSWFRCTTMKCDDQMKYRIVALFSMITVFGVVGLSALLFSSGAASRLDHWMYGRYVEPFITPIILVGLLSNSYKWLFWTVPMVFIFGLVLWLGIGPFTHVARMNIPAFWQGFYLEDQGVLAWAASGAILIIVVAFAPRYLGILLVTCLFIFASYLQINWHVHSANNMSYRLVAANVIRDLFPRGTCVGFDHSGIDSYTKHVYWFDYALTLYDYDLQRMSYDRWLENCDGPLLTYDFNYLDIGNRVFPMMVSPRNGPTVLVKGSALREKMFYPIVIEERPSTLPFILKSGWYNLEKKHVWSASIASLLLPIPNNCISASCRAVITASVFGASSSVTRVVRVKASQTFELQVQTSDRIEIEIPIDSAKIAQTIILEIPDADSPSRLWGTSDQRVLGLAIFKVELRR